MPVTIANSKLTPTPQYSNPTTLVSKENNYIPGSISDLPPVTGEKVICKRWLSVDDNTRPHKRLCVEGPPVHSRSFLVETTLEWKVNNKINKVTAHLLLDSGCTGPVLAQSFIKRNDIPVEIEKKRLHIVAANGIEVEGGTHNTKSLGVWMGKHVSEMKFESMGIREEGPFGLVGYLPMSWLVQLFFFFFYFIHTAWKPKA